MIEVTEKAIGKIRETLAKNNCQGGLRLGIVGGGCSGLSYKFKLEDAPKPNDKVFEYQDVRVFVDPRSFTHLDGLILDYTESLLESAFKFHNPNAAKSCSCGKSFQPNGV